MIPAQRQPTKCRPATAPRWSLLDQVGKDALQSGRGEKGGHMKIFGLLLGLMLLSGCGLNQHCKNNLADLVRVGCGEWATKPAN